MKLISICVQKETLEFVLDSTAAVRLTVQEYTPVVHGEQKLVYSGELSFADGKAALPRFSGRHDRAFGCFVLPQAGGVRYVTDFAPDASEFDYPYPQPDSIKTLDCPYSRGRDFGLKQSRWNVNLPHCMSLCPQEGTIPFEFEGRTYYFYEDAMQELQENMDGYENNTFILLNSPRLFSSRGEQALLDICIHPRFEWDNKSAFISAFNVTTEAGWQVYGAFIEFLAQRFTRSDAKYNRGCGFIIGNEINLQEFWGNMGDADVEYYVEEYMQAMRIAWICGKKHYSQFRVYTTLANNWNVKRTNLLRQFQGRDALDRQAELGRRDGDFDWHVAFHPYPENADFWNDRLATFDFSTETITYKNMEVLEAYLAQPQFLYRGTPRRIIFSEQGFNSGSGPLRHLREKQAEAGYVLSYLKARNMKTVDMMMHHAFVDHPHEFGLSLGLYRHDPNAPDHIGEAKPIVAAVKAMDTPAEELAIAFAREVIGEEMFDYMLHPEVHCGEAESLEDDFGDRVSDEAER